MRRVQSSTTPVALPEGIWHSQYRYPSDSRHGVFENEHFARLSRHGEAYVLDSLPNESKSQLTMRLAVEGRIATGTWRERTSPHGHYKGAVYHGAIQLVADEDCRHLQGKWVGFGKDGSVNVGAWQLTFVGVRLPTDRTTHALASG